MSQGEQRGGERVTPWKPLGHKASNLTPLISLDIPNLDLSIQLKKDEEIRTELSTKYDRPMAEDLLNTSGFEVVKWYTDPDQLISLALAKKP